MVVCFASDHPVDGAATRRIGHDARLGFDELCRSFLVFEGAARKGGEQAAFDRVGEEFGGWDREERSNVKVRKLDDECGSLGRRSWGDVR